MENQGLELVVPPPVLPVSLEAAKAHLRVDTEDEDSLISDLISAATDYVENWTGRALVQQVWEAYYPNFYPKIYLPKPPITEIESVYYKDADGVSALLDVSLYNS